jgi:hypothetical protein
MVEKLILKKYLQMYLDQGYKLKKEFIQSQINNENIECCIVEKKEE